MNFVFVTGYCMLREDLKESFFFPTRECFDDLWDYMKIGLPSAAMISLEWWSFEIQTIFASYISVASVGGMVILLNTLTIISMIPFGAQISGAVFIGKSMGEGNARKARKYTYLITFYTFLALILGGALLVYFSRTIGMIFTNQEELIEMVSYNYQFIAVFLVIHGIGMSIGGALRGMGKQSTATKCVFFGFYFVGHPTSVVCGLYLGFGLSGLLLGFTMGSFAMGILFYMSLAFFTNWEDKAVEIKKRMSSNYACQDGIDNDEIKVTLLH